MNHKPTRSFPASLSYYFIDSGRLSAVPCRHCRKSLDIHQPNPEQPDQFLGTCPGCGRWFRVASSAGGPPIAVLELPEVADINRAPARREGLA